MLAAVPRAVAAGGLLRGVGRAECPPRGLIWSELRMSMTTTRLTAAESWGRAAANPLGAVVPHKVAGCELAGLLAHCGALGAIQDSNPVGHRSPGGVTRHRDGAAIGLIGRRAAFSGRRA